MMILPVYELSGPNLRVITFNGRINRAILSAADLSMVPSALVGDLMMGVVDASLRDSWKQLEFRNYMEIANQISLRICLY